MLCAVSLFSVMDAMMKLLVEHYPPMQVTALRGLAAVPFLLLPIAIRAAGQSSVRRAGTGMGAARRSA